MNTIHFKDFSYQKAQFKADIHFSVFNENFAKAQMAFGEMLLESSRAVMPIRTGAMRQLAHTEAGGRLVIFPGVYTRFQWGGKVMVDPVTGSPWARKGAKKVLTDRPLKYGDPNATDHWTDKVWATSGEAILKRVTEIIQNGT